MQKLQIQAITNESHKVHGKKRVTTYKRRRQLRETEKEFFFDEVHMLKLISNQLGYLSSRISSS